MGVTYQGPRKYLVVLLFIAPTLLSIFVLSLFPIIYNVYISMTNRNTFHYPVYDLPPEDRAAFVEEHPAIGGFVWDVVCPVFSGFCCDPDMPGRFCVRDPFYANYVRLFEDLFSIEALKAMGKLLLVIAPLILAAVAANQLTRRNPLSPPPTWWVWGLGAAVGLALWFLLGGSAALETLNNTGSFFIVMFRTALYVIACVPFFFLFGLIMALILNNDFIRGRAIWRVLLIVPWAVPSYISALIWQFFFRTEQGTINQLLGLLGITGPSWLLDPSLAFFAVVLVNIWMSYPFFMVIILGALQSIPQEQYEAADVDGASEWQKLMSITLPLVRPAVMPAVVLSSITTFQMFNTVWLITRGGPLRGAGKPGATEFVMIHAYKQVFQAQNDGLIGAFAVIVFAILFAATLYSLRVTRITKGAYE
jgi:arabinogalactan oligomer/maltooligosaccharide transport system permease protein